MNIRRENLFICVHTDRKTREYLALMYVLVALEFRCVCVLAGLLKASRIVTASVLKNCCLHCSTCLNMMNRLIIILAFDFCLPNLLFTS